MNGVIKQKKKANAVFEGGGVKGIGIAGALTVADRYYKWQYVAGTSAGAIIAALVAAGYSAEEIRDKVYSLDYKRIQDPGRFLHMPYLGSLLSLELNLGIFKGDYIENWIRENLKSKGVERFGDLAVGKKTGHPGGRYRLRVIASDISRGKMVILPQDITRYGIDPDYLDVARAIRMSISIPFFFQPVKLTHIDEKGGKTVCYIVDGGVLSNFPVWLFDRNEGPEQLPTIGFKLVGPNEGQPNNIRGPLSMLKAVVDTMMDAHDNRYIEDKNFARTIAIPTLGVRTTDFNITREKCRLLFRSGVEAAERFFREWDHQAYLRKYAVKADKR